MRTRARTRASVSWSEASARRMRRQFLTVPAPAGTPVAEVVAEVVGAMLGAHAQVLSAAEVSVGVRAEGVTRADVRAALWADSREDGGRLASADRGIPSSTDRGDRSSTDRGDRSSTDRGDRSSTDRGDRSSTDRGDRSSTDRGDRSSADRGDRSSTDPASPSLVKTHGPRGTVHLLAASELPLWTSALSAIPSGTSPFAPDARLTDEQADEVVAAIADALDGAFLTIDELNDEVVARTGSWAGDLVMPAFQGMWPRWRQVMHRAGLRGALCFGPNRGRKVTYTRPPRFEPLAPDEALSALVRRYLRAYGPATPQQFAKWAAAQRGWVLDLFSTLAAAGEIEEVDFEGTEGPAWVAAGDTEFPDEPVRGVRLLPYFDAYAIAAGPRELLFPGAAYERALAGGQAGNYPVLLVDGVVAGVWHQRRQGRRTTVTVEPLGRLTAAQRRELAERVERVGEVLEAKPELVVGKVTAGPHA